MWKSEMWLTRGEKEENLRELSRREAWLYLKNLSANNRNVVWSATIWAEKWSFHGEERSHFPINSSPTCRNMKNLFYMNVLFNPFRSIRVETKCYVTDAPSVSKKTWKGMYRFGGNFPIMLRMKAWLNLDDVLNSVGFWPLIFHNSKPVSFSLRALFSA